MTAPTNKPMTPAVQAVAALHITGNVIPHVWYQRTEFRTPSGKPDQRMITILADILYWYRPREVRDEDTGALIAFERKFQRDMLQYDYARRGAMFGLEPRPTAEACKALARVGLIRIEYRTLIHGGRPYNNVVFVEPIPDAIKATLTEPNVPDVPRPKKAARGMHARKPSSDTLGVSDLPDVNDLTDEHPAPPLLLNLGPGGEDPLLQNLGEPFLQNFGPPPPKFRRTNNEISSDISLYGDFNSSITPDTPLATHTPDDEGPSPVGEPLNTHTQQAGETPDPLDAGPEIHAQPSAGPEVQPALEDSEDLPFFTGLSPDLEATKLERATEVQQVPPAAPAEAPDPLDAPWAILALTPIPLATLDTRPERDPTRMPQLRALMQATSPTRLAHLQEQLLITLPGGVSRQYLTRLTDDEIQAAARAASHDAARVKGGMPSAGYHALDRLLGKEFTPESLSGQRKAVRTNEAPRHRSHQATNDGRFSDDQPAAGEADGALQSGRAWQHMKNGQIVVIHAVENDRTEVVLTDGTRHPMARFVTTYRRVAIAEATG